MLSLQRIISGGQTGADRAALDWARERDIPHGGWCPLGRRAEDGPLAAEYLLDETPSEDYALRTAWNVRDADATVIFSLDPKLQGGSALTERIAQDMRRPCLHLHPAQGTADCAARLLNFIDAHRVAVLNVAGPRASHEPGIGAWVRQVLDAAWQLAADPGNLPDG